MRWRHEDEDGGGRGGELGKAAWRTREAAAAAWGSENGGSVTMIRKRRK
jgi:hypothetical protein